MSEKTPCPKCQSIDTVFLVINKSKTDPETGRDFGEEWFYFECNECGFTSNERNY
jgi:uncharacterized Zn finger protein